MLMFKQSTTRKNYIIVYITKNKQKLCNTCNCKLSAQREGRRSLIFKIEKKAIVVS